MKTRQIIPTLALLLILSTTATAVTPRHRHQPQTEQTAPASSTTQQNTQGQGNTIEAYSDTTTSTAPALPRLLPPMMPIPATAMTIQTTIVSAANSQRLSVTVSLADSRSSWYS